MGTKYGQYAYKTAERAGSYEDEDLSLSWVAEYDSEYSDVLTFQKVRDVEFTTRNGFNALDLFNLLYEAGIVTDATIAEFGEVFTLDHDKYPLSFLHHVYGEPLWEDIQDIAFHDLAAYYAKLED